MIFKLKNVSLIVIDIYTERAVKLSIYLLH